MYRGMQSGRWEFDTNGKEITSLKCNILLCKLFNHKILMQSVLSAVAVYTAFHN